MTAADLTSFPYFDTATPIALAHRGGSLLHDNIGIENSLTAFRHATELGYRYLETDVHCSADGVVYAFHDDNLERLTGNPALINSLSSTAIDAVRLDGREPIPTLRQLFEELPEARFNIDVKADSAVDATLDLIGQCGAVDRVCLASFSHARLQRIRSQLPNVASSFSPREVAWLKIVPIRRLQAASTRGGAVCAQVPHRRGRITVVNRRFVDHAHALGIQVHVWTIDDADEMNELLDLGVDGLVSDRIDTLKEVLTARGQWRSFK